MKNRELIKTNNNQWTGKICIFNNNKIFILYDNETKNKTKSFALFSFNVRVILLYFAIHMRSLYYMQKKNQLIADSSAENSIPRRAHQVMIILRTKRTRKLSKEYTVYFVSFCFMVNQTYREKKKKTRSTWQFSHLCTTWSVNKTWVVVLDTWYFIVCAVLR